MRVNSGAKSPTMLSVHGDVADHELLALGQSRNDVVDFAVNVNPYGSPPGLREFLADLDVSRYPDRGCSELYSALQEHTGAPRAELCVGNGASELLWAAVRAWVPRGGKLLSVEPTFSEAISAARAQQSPVVQRWLSAETGFLPDAAQLRRWLEQDRPSAVYLCQPNNPTGAYWDPNELAAVANEHPEISFLLDEAFLALSEHFADAQFPYPKNVMRIRSLTKDLAIAGLRLGYALGAPPRAAALAAGIPPWSVNTVAQAAGTFGLKHWDYVEASREQLLSDRRALQLALEQQGWSPLPSTSIFVLVRVEDGLLAQVGDGASLRTHCLKHGILIRDCASFGLPQHVRLCARPAADRARLLACLKQ